MSHKEFIVCYIGLGSNLDNPQKHVEQAMQELDDLDGCEVLQCSSLYTTKPVGPIQDQPDFINAVVKLQTSLVPLDLFDELLRLEQLHDRVRDNPQGPRTLDLDILLYGDAVIDDSRLQVPHPEMCNREFVMVPLREIAPDVVVPKVVAAS